MSWKDWPYWVRGGVIGVLVYFILALLVVTYIFSVATSSDDGLALIVIFLPGLWLTQKSIFALLINLLSFFIIGAIIGWIIGKIKERKENN
jgi:hypothetical protein